MRDAFRRLFLLLSVLVILVVVLPWTSFQDHTHWQRIRWVPLVDPPVRLRDIIGNVLLYLPFGFWHARQAGQPRLWRTAFYAVALSLTTELAQVFSHGRFPSTADVLCNLTGALWGGRWAGQAQRGRSKAATMINRNTGPTRQ